MLRIYLLLPLLGGCPAPPHWEQSAEEAGPSVLLQDSAKEAAFDLGLALDPVVDGRDGKAGTLHLTLELEATFTGVGGTRPLTSLLLFAEDPDEPVPQMANVTPDEGGVTLYRVGYQHPCNPRKGLCELNYTVLFEQLGAGSVQVEWSARALASGGQQAIDVMSDETTVELSIGETSL